jgi:MFS family permease
MVNAALGSVAANLIGQYIGIFATRLGADNLQLGYLSSWPQLASVISVLVIAGAVARSASKQRLIAAIYLVGRLAGLLAAAVPWFPERWRVWALIGSWVLVVFPTGAAASAQNAFLADVFPGSERAKAFASRNSWASGAGTVTILVTGWLLDLALPYPLGYQVMFGLSFLVALVEVYYFLQMREPAEKPADEPAALEAEPPRIPGARGGRAKLPPPPGSGLKTYLHCLTYKPFQTFLLFSIPFHFTWQMAWPIFTRYQVTDLGMNNTWLSYITVAQSLSMVFCYPFWARWAERKGNLVMLGWAALNLMTAPVMTAALASIKLQVLLNLWTGIGVAGVNLLVLNALLEVSPSEGRAVFVAVHTALVSVSAAIAPLVGSFLMDALPTRVALAVCSVPRGLTALSWFLLVYLGTRRKGNAPTSENSRPKAAI